jgi:Domain of unknown function (DUF6431)
MAIVWPTELDVDAYAEAGRGVVVPRLACPGCRRPLRFWGWYERDLRVTAVVIRRLEVRRGRCQECRRTHALLPGFVTWGRLDTVEVIGPALEAMCAGAGMRPVAEGLDLKHTTVRDWRRRFAQRASSLAIGFCRYVVALGDVAPRLSGAVEEVALGAIRSAWAAAGRRFGQQVEVLWRLANAVVGGHLLSTNMDPPWAAA